MGRPWASPSGGLPRGTSLHSKLKDLKSKEIGVGKEEQVFIQYSEEHYNHDFRNVNSLPHSHKTGGGTTSAAFTSQR